jgi:predicted CoA-binding protein
MNLIDKDKFIYLIVGASNNPDKYGYKILKDLKEAGFNVNPINLKEEVILNLQVYPSVGDFVNSIKPDVDNLVVDFVVPPQVTIEILKEVRDLGINKVWLQPGSESDESIKFCIENNFHYVANACIMVKRRDIS